MYNQYILDYLRSGGAKIEKRNTLDIPSTSIKVFTSPEIILNPMGQLDRIPPINKENLSYNPTLSTGAQSIKECKLILSNAMGDGLPAKLCSQAASTKLKLMVSW